MALCNPVIVIPGITATYLRDEYPLPPETIWTVLNKDYERSALHPDDIQSKIQDRERIFELREPARIRSGQLYEVAYKELIEELRHNLREREDREVPVYAFGYDWRQPLELIERELALFVAEVIDRTKLLKHYHAAGYGSDPKVNLVGHSMGGLVLAGYLEREGGARVHKVATLATPFQGSFEAVIKVTTGTADLGTSAPSSREREAARLTPALYYLLPSFANGLKIAPGLPNTLFDPGAWQTSICDTIAEYIRLRGLTPGNRRQQAQQIFAALLSGAQNHRNRIGGFRLSDAGLTPADWLCVVGVNAKTRVRLEIGRRAGAPNFEFHSSDRDNGWTESDVERRRMTGDGTVPFEGALPPFLNIENVICVTPDDFGYWELQDRALTELSGFHGILPNMDMLHRLIVRHFTGRRDKRGNIWGRAAPGVDNPVWPWRDLKKK